MKILCEASLQLVADIVAISLQPVAKTTRGWNVTGQENAAWRAGKCCRIRLGEQVFRCTRYLVCRKGYGGTCTTQGHSLLPQAIDKLSKVVCRRVRRFWEETLGERRPKDDLASLNTEIE
jgi:hypothetical protein